MFDFNDPVFRTYVVAAALMVLKMMGQIWKGVQFEDGVELKSEQAVELIKA